MKRLLARIVFAVDRHLPKARVEGRGSTEAYSLWEYRTGKELLERFGPMLGPLAGKSVLDVGCGLGGKTIAYAEAGARVVGVDISEERISQCRIFSSRLGERSPVFVVGDARRIPFADSSFDMIIANDSLEHFTDPLVALLEFERILKPAGTLALFFTPWGSPLGSHLYDYIRTPWCHLIFPEWLIRELLVLSLEERGQGDSSSQARELMREYHTELNRITVTRFHRILEQTKSLRKIHEERLPPKYRFLAPLAKVPLLGELFTGTVVSILSKRHSA